MNITIGKTVASMMDPPNEGTVITSDNKTWKIGRNWQGMIVLRDGITCHPDFRDGMDMHQFVCWINQVAGAQS